jgi:hypothetical protein
MSKALFSEREVGRDMTRFELAKALNGLQYPLHLSGELVAKAKENGLVIVYGGSDDLMEFEGAIHDEIGAYNGVDAKVCPAGVLGCRGDIETDEELEEYLANKKIARLIQAVWDSEGYSWVYRTDIEHTTFDIMEDDCKYCRGIVFSLSDM